MEAEYQDDVRLEIDNLGTAFVDLLTARASLDASRAGLADLDATLRQIREEARPGAISPLSVDRAEIYRDRTVIELERAADDLPPASADARGVAGDPPRAGRADRGPGDAPRPHQPPLSLEELITIALTCRPDLVAYRFECQQARSTVDLTRAERLPDAFLFYTPYGFKNHAWENKPSSTSWGIGGLFSVPLFDRNQGNIRRARHDLLRTRIEQEGLQRQIVSEVHRAYLAYQNTRAAVRRIEQSTLPRAQRLQRHLQQARETDAPTLSEIMDTRRDVSEIVRLYIETLADHRRNMLRLNTAVGRRIVP